MPLRNIEQDHAWVGREGPTADVQRVVRHFLAEIGDEAWRTPSVPIAELSQQPEYEVRSATLIAADASTVQVWYRHFYADDAVDVLAVTGRTLTAVTDVRSNPPVGGPPPG